MGGRGWAGWSGVKGRKRDNCNSIINKYIKKKDTSYGTISIVHTHRLTGGPGKGTLK